MLGYTLTPVPYNHSISLISKETYILWLAANTGLISVTTAQVYIKYTCLVTWHWTEGTNEVAWNKTVKTMKAAGIYKTSYCELT
jgi:hypothetical protein